MKLSREDIARMIDVSAVQAYHSDRDVRKLAELSKTHGFVAAHVLPNFVPLLRAELEGSRTIPGAPVGFPAGGNTVTVKVAEARELAAAGVREMDLMINLGRLLSGEHKYVRDEIQQVVGAVGPVPVKVILEVSYLDDDQIKEACELCIKAGAAFVKTSTGWAAPAASIGRIKLITDFVRGAIKVKASGGIRDLKTVVEMVALGVSRFGINTQAAVAILESCPVGADPAVR